jgi:hypothetical protein
MHTSISRLLAILVLACTALSGCGGGGGGNPTTASAAPATSASAPAPASAPATVPTQPVTAQTPAAPTNTTVAPSTTPNVQPITVAQIATSTRNMLQTSVTICVPGTSTCQTIDNIQVDTGSQGLRILSAALALPAVSTGSGSAAAECTVFGSGFTWGSVRSADIELAGEVAPATSVQIISDPAIPAAPSDCSASGLPMLTATSLRSNGILGVGPFTADCGSGCASAALPRWYYGCANGACMSSTLAVVQQVTQPVSRFATDNNGVVIELPALAAAGAPSVAGTMTFGIGSQSNNALGSAQVLPSNTLNGFVSTIFQGQTYSTSFIDSGSNGLFFVSSSVPKCGLWFCPSAAQSFTATITGNGGATNNVTFSIGNATSLFASGNNAFNNLAGSAANYFDWGLPFFFGRRVFTAIEAQVTPAGNGPYYAF